MGRLTPDFSDDVAIVTGGASGIGLAIVRALALAGARVHVFDPGQLPDLELDADAPIPHFHAVDVRDTAQVDAAVKAVLAEEDCVDLLVSNAGINRDHALWKLSDEEWAEVIDVNLTASHRLLRALAPSMRERGRGRVVLMASINGLRGKFGQANYGASKGGLLALTRTAARELGPRGITVNAVAPGMTQTAMFEALSEEVRTTAVEESALGRIAEPNQIADAVLFLLSDQAAHITGTTLVVDGGQTA
jgi:acetoacetyl-CoA reductase/3-oxoacyl-[acyl-carrier protein] reductase